MNIIEFRERKKRLDRELQTRITKLVRDFAEETGVTPSKIEVELIETSTIIDPRPMFDVGRVKTEVII